MHLNEFASSPSPRFQMAFCCISWLGFFSCQPTHLPPLARLWLRFIFGCHVPHLFCFSTSWGWRVLASAWGPARTKTKTKHSWSVVEFCVDWESKGLQRAGPRRDRAAVCVMWTVNDVWLNRVSCASQFGRVIQRGWRHTETNTNSPRKLISCIQPKKIK